MGRMTHAGTEQLNIGQLIAQLKAIRYSEDCTVWFCFGHFFPTAYHSWRGSYEEFAIGYDSVVITEAPKIQEVINRLEQSASSTMTGYKGGEFSMDYQTPVWVANHNESGVAAVVNVHGEYGRDGKAYRVYIHTAYCEF